MGHPSTTPASRPVLAAPGSPLDLQPEVDLAFLTLSGVLVFVPYIGAMVAAQAA